MKKTWMVLIVLVFVLIIFGGQAASAKAGETGQDFQFISWQEFDHLMSWTASRMGIVIDTQKPKPVLTLVSGEELQRIAQEKSGKKFDYTTEDGRMKVRIYLTGYYHPPEFTLYVAADRKEESVRESVVHELVHYFQHVYRGFAENSKDRELEAQRIEMDYCEGGNASSLK